MNKAYNRVNGENGWQDYPSLDTPLNKQNLDKVDIGLNEVDNRVIILDETKATKTEISTLFKEVSYEESTGIITFTRKSGATVTIDTPMEKIQTGIYYNPNTEKLVLPLIDGTSMEVDLSRLMKFDEFVDSATIAFSVKSNGTVTAIVKEGSIEEKHLQPNYLSDIKVEVAKAQGSATAASENATAADSYAKKSKSYAVGGTGAREGEGEDNAKYYSEQAKASAEQASNIITQNVVLQSEKGVAGGVATLDGNGKVPSTQLSDASGAVTSVNGQTGNVNITKEDIGLGNVDNTADANKSVNYAASAGSATKATNDGNGNNIVNTYVQNSKIIDDWATAKATTQTGYPVGALALQKAIGKELEQTLAANSTSVSFTDAAITDASTFDFYTSAFGVNPTAASVSGNKLTLAFKAQTTDISVKVRIT